MVLTAGAALLVAPDCSWQRYRLRRLSPLVALAVILYASIAAADGGAPAIDEPGLEGTGFDEPGIVMRAAPSPSLPRMRVELGFGLSSLLVDPDVSPGMAASLSVGARVYRRLGFEVAGCISQNRFKGQMGQIGSTLLDNFIAGNVSLGPTLRLTPAGSPFAATIDFLLGAYVVAPALQQTNWSFGVATGVALSWRLIRWLSVGIRLRYHIFNLGRLAGPALRDRSGLSEIGAVDRLELPGYVSFAF